MQGATSADRGGALHLGLTHHAVVFGSGDQVAWFDVETMAPLGDALTVGSDLSAFTPIGDTVLAWPSTSTAPPQELRPPSA